MPIENGDYVEVNHVGKLEDGTIFDSSIEGIAKKSTSYDPNRKYEPLGFTVGEGMLIEGFEKGVLAWMSVIKRDKNSSRVCLWKRWRSPFGWKDINI